MSTSAIFFQGSAEHFFRPLTRQDREACAAVLRDLHDRVHGPDADYSQPLTRDLILDVCAVVIAQPAYRAGALSDAQVVNADAERSYALGLLRALKEHGWIEDYKDPIDLQPVLKLTRAGKAFAETFAELDNSRHKTRQRNMRSARKALQAFLDPPHDEDELLDAHDYASRVVQDLQDDIEYFRTLMQSLTREALARKLAWDEFNEFIEHRFAREMATRLVADSVDRHRGQIVELLDQIRAWPAEQRQRCDALLRQRAGWLAGVLGDDRSATHWLCQRIEALVDAACELKLPMLRSEMHNYMRRFTSLLRQALSLDYGAESPMGLTLNGIKAAEPAVKQDWLERLGARLGTSELRLLPAGGVRWTQRERQQVEGSETEWRIRQDSRLEAAMRRAVAEAFVISEDRVLAQLERRGIACLRLSDLPAAHAEDVLTSLHAVGAARSLRGQQRWQVRKLETRYETAAFVADDYELRPVPKA